MKRLIKYWQTITNDAVFSDCSTKYEILPVLVDDTAGIDELKKHTKALNIPIGRMEAKFERGSRVNCAIKVMETKELPCFNGKEVKQVWLGFYQLPTRGPLTPVETLDNPVTDKQAYDIVNGQYYGVSDTGENIDGKIVLVKSGWNYYHDIAMLGYSRESFEESQGIEDEGFEDDIYRCGRCGKLDRADDGYTYNHRVVAGDLLGVNCGCFDEYCQSEEGIENYINNPNEAMEMGTAEKLVEKKKLKHLERFIGGWTDGRGGYFRGESTREGNPTEVLREYREKYPKAKFVFSHDESGQFQTYFSIYKVMGQK